MSKVSRRINIFMGIVILFATFICLLLTEKSEARPAGNSEIELRHPANHGYYWKKNKRTWVRFYWKYLTEDPQNYVLQVSKTRDFKNIIHEHDVTGSLHIWETKRVGWYYWRMVSLAADNNYVNITKTRRFNIVGEEGEVESEKPAPIARKVKPRKNLNDYLELRHPKNNGYYWSSNHKTWVRFYWKYRKQDQETYTLQVSTSRNFHDIIHEHQVTDAPHIWETKRIGWYYWRIALLDDDKNTIGVTSHRRFKIIPDEDLAKPEIKHVPVAETDTGTRKTISEDHLELRHPKDGGYYWSKNQQTWVRFYFRFNNEQKEDVLIQVSRDIEFKELVHQRRLRDKPYIWRNRLAGLFHWRLGIYNEDGSIKAFTPSRSYLIRGHEDNSPRRTIKETMSLSSKPIKKAVKAPVVKAKPVQVPPPPQVSQLVEVEVEPVMIPVPKEEKLEPISELETEGPDKVDFKFTSLKPSASFSWQDIEEFEYYLFQMSFDRKFRTLDLNEKLSSSSYSMGDLSPGNYYWRVVVRQHKDLPLFFSAVKSFKVTKIKPNIPAPELEKPDAGAEFLSYGSDVTVDFEWDAEADTDGSSFLLDISKDKDFKHSIARTTLEEKTSLNLSPGQYYWRVRQINSEGSDGKWSEGRALVVKKSLKVLSVSKPKPNMASPEFLVQFEWEEMSDCDDYRLTVSGTKSFDKVLLEETVDEGKFEFEFDDEDTYYWFATCLGDDGKKILSKVNAFEINLDAKVAH